MTISKGLIGVEVKRKGSLPLRFIHLSCFEVLYIFSNVFSHAFPMIMKSYFFDHARDSYMTPINRIIMIFFWHDFYFTSMVIFSNFGKNIMVNLFSKPLPLFLKVSVLMPGILSRQSFTESRKVVRPMLFFKLWKK